MGYLPRNEDVTGIYIARIFQIWSTPASYEEYKLAGKFEPIKNIRNILNELLII